MNGFPTTRWALALGVVTSVGLHAFVAAALSSIPPAPSPPAVVQVEVSLAEPIPVEAPLREVPEADPDPGGTPPEAPAPVARTESAPRPAAESEPETESETDVPPADPLDLTGTTLTASGGAWAATPGNGAPRKGPIRSSSRRRGRPTATRTPSVSRPRVVAPTSSLAQPPRAPNLDGTLKRNYPPAARAQGVAGEAVVRVQIGSDGRVGGAVVVGESFAGFGEACRRTVMGSVWQAPRDETGRAYATTVRYRCRFRVD